MRKVYAFTTGTQATLAGIVTVPMVDFSEDCNGVSIHYNLTGVQFSLVFHLPCLSLKKNQVRADDSHSSQFATTHI